MDLAFNNRKIQRKTTVMIGDGLNNLNLSGQRIDLNLSHLNRKSIGVGKMAFCLCQAGIELRLLDRFHTSSPDDRISVISLNTHLNQLAIRKAFFRLPA